MLNKWRGWLLMSVVAVCGANIIGVYEPVRAQEVTYSLENTELANPTSEVTGSIEYNNGYIEGSLYADVNGSEEEFSLGLENATTQPLILDGNGGDYLQLDLNQFLNGQQGQTVQIVSNDSYLDYNSNELLDNFEGGGQLTAEVASTPEPTSSIATVIAVTFGLVVSGKRRKLSAREKMRTAHER